MPPFEVAKSLRLPPLHAEQVSRARHVDVEESPAHQEIRRLRRDVLGELRQSLRGDYAGKAALAAAAHQVGHGAEGKLARLVGNLAGGGRREELRLVHHHQHRIPMIARDFEQPAEEGGGAPHLVLGIEPLEVEHRRDAMDARPLASRLQAAFAMLFGSDHQMAVTLAKRHEVAFGVDNGLLHPGCALLQQTAQQMRLARTRIALDQQARRQQFLKVEDRGRACRRLPHLDCNRHVSTRISLPAPGGLSNRRAMRRAADGHPRGVPQLRDAQGFDPRMIFSTVVA